MKVPSSPRAEGRRRWVSSARSSAATIGGYIIGNEQDKSEMKAAQQSTLESANTFVINVRNSNGSITAVPLRRQGNMWVGPQGEMYTSLPTEAQLRPLYGR